MAMAVDQIKIHMATGSTMCPIRNLMSRGKLSKVLDLWLTNQNGFLVYIYLKLAKTEGWNNNYPMYDDLDRRYMYPTMHYVHILVSWAIFPL